MIEIYREKDIVLIPKLQAILEEADIPTFTRNLALGQVEVQIPDFFPALCLVYENDLTKAREIVTAEVERFKNGSIEEITCPSCGETNPASFEICWNCSHEF